MSFLNKKILFFGSDLISLTTLKVIQPQIKNLEVVVPACTKPRTPLHQLHQYLKQQQIPTFFEFNNHQDNLWLQLSQKLSQYPKDLGLIASFGHMIPNNIIEQFPHEFIIMHPSLLPKYRGACPIQHTLLNQEPKAGVSLIRISKNKFDAGSILYQKPIDINEHTTFKDLSEQLAKLGGEGILEIISNLDYFMANSKQQDESQSSKAPMIKSSFGELKFGSMNSSDIQIRFNALYGSNTKPRFKVKACEKQKILVNTHAFIEGIKKVKSDSDIMSELEKQERVEPGIIYWNNQKDEIYVKCQGDKKDWIKFDCITLSSLGKLSAKNFLDKVLKSQKQYRKGDFDFQFE